MILIHSSPIPENAVLSLVQTYHRFVDVLHHRVKLVAVVLEVCIVRPEVFLPVFRYLTLETSDFVKDS